MKKSILAVIAMVLCSIMLFGCAQTAPQAEAAPKTEAAAPAAAPKTETAPKADAAPAEEEGQVYNIRVAVNSAYRGQAVVDAGNVLNAQLEAEGCKDRVNAEFIEVESVLDSFNIWSREDNLPELAQASIAALSNTLYKAGYLVDNAVVVNDDAYTSNLTPAMRALGQNFYDPSYYNGVIYDTEFRMVMIYKPALQQLGWSEEQIEQWKQDARAGKVTVAELQSIAKQIVDAGICEYGITHRSEKCADWRFTFITWCHGQVPVDADGNVVIRKDEMKEYLDFFRTNVQMGLTPYNFTTDYTSDMLYGDILPHGKAFAYYGHVEIKSRMVNNAGVDPEWVDENFFSIPNPVTVLGDKPFCGCNPAGISMTVSVEKDPKLKEYTARLLDCLLDDEIQLDLSLRSGHVAIAEKTMATDEYQADKWMCDTEYVGEYIQALPAIDDLPKYGHSQELWDALQEAAVKANDPSARSTKEIVDECVELMTFNMDDGKYVIVDWQ